MRHRPTAASTPGTDLPDRKFRVKRISGIAGTADFVHLERMKRTALMIALAGISGSLIAEEPAPPPAVAAITVTKENAFTFYRGYKRMTPKPYQVSPVISALCSTSVAGAVEAAAKEHGPHVEAHIHVYASETAARKLDQRLAEPYAEGSVIVKEKLADGDAVTAIGGMIKRAKGYDPEHGDWEYFYATKGGDFSTGKMQNCIQCHTGAKDHDYFLGHDYVFAKWLPQSPPK
jgi:hypothetical protein